MILFIVKTKHFTEFLLDLSACNSLLHDKWRNSFSYLDTYYEVFFIFELKFSFFFPVIA